MDFERIQKIYQCYGISGINLDVYTHKIHKCCFEAWKKSNCKHYSISNKKSFTILEVARLFSDKIKFIPSRPGERYASALTDMNLSNKVLRRFGKKSLVDYIRDFKKSLKID